MDGLDRIEGELEILSRQTGKTGFVRRATIAYRLGVDRLFLCFADQRRPGRPNPFSRPSLTLDDASRAAPRSS